jgi:hypothetical protein
VKLASLLLALNFEVVSFVIIAVYLGRVLNVEYQHGFNWFFVTLPLGGGLILHAIVRFFRILKKMDESLRK